MAKCTAPVNGHRTASARAACPACGGRGRYSYTYSYQTYSSNEKSFRNETSSRGGLRSRKPNWSSPSSGVYYTPAEIRTLTPVRKNIEKRASITELHDVFLCHAWDDRKDAAKELHDLLENNGVSVWFSEKSVLLGSPLLREIDKGLANSRVGIVLVTPAFINRIKQAGIAEKELSALLARDLLVPIVHNTTYEKLREVSPLLGSRSGLDTNEEPMYKVALKLAELVEVEEQAI